MGGRGGVEKNVWGKMGEEKGERRKGRERKYIHLQPKLVKSLLFFKITNKISQKCYG